MDKNPKTLVFACLLAGILLLSDGTGCTMNFWGRRTGIVGGELTGAVTDTLLYVDGCDDLNLFATTEESDIMLNLELSNPLQAMAAAHHRLETLVLDDPSAFTLTLWRGNDLYELPCDYGGYYYYYYYDDDEPSQDTSDEPWSPGGAAWETYTFTDGSIRVHLTAQRRRWDPQRDTIHAKAVMQDVTLTNPENGATVFIDGLIMQTYVYQWYWY